MPRMTPGLRWSALTFAALLASHTRLAPAGTIVPIWSGNTANWEDPSQWTPNIVPDNAGTDLYAPIIKTGNASLNSSAVISALTLQYNASLHVASGNTLVLTGELASVLNGQLDLASSAAAYVNNVQLAGYFNFVTGAGDLHITGTNNTWSAGTMVGQGTTFVDAGASLAMTAWNGYSANQRSIINNGTITTAGGGYYIAPFVNNGSLIVDSSQTLNFSLQSATTPLSTFTNHGLITFSAHAGAGETVMVYLPFFNDGVIAFNGTSSALSCGFNSTTNFIAGTVTTANVNSCVGFGPSGYGTTTLSAATLDGPGSFSGGSLTSFLLQGINQVSNLTLYRLEGTGDLNITTSMTLGYSKDGGDTFATTGEVSVGPNATLTIATLPAYFPNGFTLTLDHTHLHNQGAASIPHAVDQYFDVLSTTFLLKNSAAFVNDGSLSVSSNLAVTGDGSPGLLFSSTGTISINSATLSINVPSVLGGSIVFNAGSLSMNSPFSYSGGTIGAPTALYSCVEFDQCMTMMADTTIYRAIIGGSLTQGATVVAGHATLTTSGSQWSSGKLSSPVNIIPGAIADLTGLQFITNNPNFLIGTQHPKIIDGVSLTVAPGAVLDWVDLEEWSGGCTIDLKGGATIVNNGNFYISHIISSVGSSIVNADGNSANALVNHGTFGSSFGFVAPNAVPTSVNVPVFSDGLIDVQQVGIVFAAGFQDTSTGSNASTFNVAVNSSLSFTGGTVAIHSPMTNINGTLLLNASSQSVASIVGTGVLSVGTPLTSDGVSLLGGTWIINGIQTIRSSGTAGAYAMHYLGQDATVLSGTSVTSNLTFGAGAKLDLQNNALIVEATSANKVSLLTQIATDVTQGYITSSSVASNSAYTLVVALDNSNINASKFGGVPVNSNSIIVTEALKGDGNLDGYVDLTDFNIWLSNLGISSSAYEASTGDLNSDGYVDLTDFNQWLSDLGHYVGTNPAPSLATDGSLAVGAGLSSGGAAATPESGSLALLGLGVAGLLTRRRAARRNLWFPHRTVPRMKSLPRVPLALLV